MAVADLQDRSVPWRTCTTCHALDGLDKKKAAILRDLLANPTVRYSELSDELRTDPDWQLDVPRHALARHARGECDARERLRGVR